MLSANRLLPGRCPAVVVAGRHSRPAGTPCRAPRRRRSAPRRRCCRCIRPESFSQVSLPNSPRLRNRVKDPEALAGAHVERRARSPSRCACSSGAPPVRCAAPTTTTSFGDDRRRVQADLAGDRIDRPGRRSASDRRRRPCRSRSPAARSARIERDQLVAGRHVDDAFVAAVGPVRERRGPRAGAAPLLPRLPSSTLYIHSSSPVAASSATTARRDPAVV